ncbi:MAG: integrase [Oleiphilaceae bacterium]|jgi:integrase
MLQNRCYKMPKKTLKLNPMQVDNAKPTDREYSLSDGDGLYLRVKPTGSRLWIFNYTQPISKKRKNISYGLYPDVGLAAARKKAERDRALLKQTIDPLVERINQQAKAKQTLETTFQSIADEWLGLQQTKLAPSTFKKNSRYFAKDIYPVIGSYPISDISASLGIQVIKRISGRGSQEIARKASRAMNQVMTYAVNTGRVTHNPLAGIKETIPKSKVQHRPTLEIHEITELMQALRYSSAKVITRCLIEFQLLTMVRPREAAEAKWSEIDFENKLWVIPAERMKMNIEHKVPLSKQVLILLKTIKPFSGHREYIFPSHIHPNKPANSQSANKALRDMGFAGRLVAHGLRALASTTLNEKGFDDDVIETALAHKDSNKIRQAYNRAKYLERRRVMMQWWAEHIDQAKTGNVSLAGGTKTLRLINE